MLKSIILIPRLGPGENGNSEFRVTSVEEISGKKRGENIGIIVSLVYILTLGAFINKHG